MAILGIDLPAFFLSFGGLGISITLLYGLYNLFLHPLASYPGPLLRRAYQLPQTISVLRGYPHLDVLALHQKYGPVVRLAPDELSYATSSAYRAIYGHYDAHTHGFTELDKDRREYGQPVYGPHAILAAEKEPHARFRRLLSPGFSEKGMRESQERIQGFVDLLVKGLREEGVEKDQFLDMRQWYNWTTFDLIGDLAFGESFGCLETRQHNPWVDAVFNNVKFVPFLQTLKRYGAGGLVPWLAPKKLRAAHAANYAYAAAKITRRLTLGTSRGDFMDNVLLRSDLAKGTGMTQPEMVNNASNLVLGGSETTATLLAGTTYLLLKHPDVLRKLNAEVRTSFASEAEIDLLSVGRLEWMGAVFDEAMRIYPPTPNIGNRLVPAQGVEICGRWVPGGTSIGVPQYPSNLLAANFTRPDEFLPERYLPSASEPSSPFAGDDRAARQPFSMGTRNCIGQNLAYAEMRLVLAKVIWNFDLELDEARSGKWLEGQKVFVLWEKPALWVRLREAEQ